MTASLKYPGFYLAPEEHMVYVFWREEAVTTRRLLTEAGGWAGQEVVDAAGRRYLIRRCRETGPAAIARSRSCRSGSPASIWPAAAA